MRQIAHCPLTVSNYDHFLRKPFSTNVMTDGRRKLPPSTHAASRPEDWPEKMKVSLARHFLGVSHTKITNLINSGLLQFEIDPLDHRVKLIRRSELEALARKRTQD